MKAVLLTLLLALCSLAHATPLEAWAEEWKAGTALPDHPDYQDVYETTREREFRVLAQVQDGDVILALYELELTTKATGVRVLERGVAAFYLRDDRVVATEHVVLEGGGVDPALVGQAADAATTAAGLAAGLAEGNPAVAGLVSSPAGLVAFAALKLGLAKAAGYLPFQDCIEAKRTLAGMGWAAAAWNVAAMVANPAAGIAAALVAWFVTTDRAPAMRACALAKVATQ